LKLVYHEFQPDLDLIIDTDKRKQIRKVRVTAVSFLHLFSPSLIDEELRRTGGSNKEKFRLFDLSLRRLVSLGIVVLLTCALSLAPFAHQLPQLLARLFPFKR
jgi:hypothetical protein